MNYLQTMDHRWVRSRDGMLGGVCEGLGRRFGIDPWVLRLLWLGALLAFGTGLILYLILVWTLPREDQLAEAQSKKFLGVCAALSRRTGLEVGLIRALTVLVALPSLGLGLLVYVVLYFVLPDTRQTTILV